MDNKICLPTTHVLIIFCVFIGFTAWYIHNDKKKHLNDYDYKYEDSIINKINKQIKQKEITEEFNKRQFLINRDTDMIYDDLAPPERRVPGYQYPTKLLLRKINIPTRGYPDNYQLTGVLLRDNTETAFKLFGRQKYPGSNQYEYYAQGVMGDNDIKLPIKINGDKEIEDGQVINIPGTNSNRGVFKVKLYDMEIPRYLPDVI
jgi:hypothetical protein